MDPAVAARVDWAPMFGRLSPPEIEHFLARRDLKGLREALLDRLAPDIADLIEDLPDEDRAAVLIALPRGQAADVFGYLPLEVQEGLIKGLARERLAALLNEMAPDDRTALFEELPSEVTHKLITLLTPEERRVAQNLLGYPEKSIGRLMTPDYVSVRADWDLTRVMEHLREVGRDSETLNILYVTDAKGKLLDDIRLRDVVLADPARKVEDLMDGVFVSLRADSDQETAIAVFRDYDRVALPVSDTKGYLVGIVTVDDVLDVAEYEATEDIQRIGGMVALEEPYMEAPFLRMVRSRVGWLVVLFLGEMLTATAMGFFEDEIRRAVVLALFVPLIISSGGNSGSQAATLIVRALALGQVTVGDWWRIFRREVFSGLCLGTVLGLVGFARIAVWARFTDLYGPHWQGVALTVAIALLGVVLWGTLMGSMLPLLLMRLGLDPATSSAPFVATLVDVFGIALYFGVAVLFLQGTLL